MDLCLQFTLNPIWCENLTVYQTLYLIQLYVRITVDKIDEILILNSLYQVTIKINATFNYSKYCSYNFLFIKTSILREQNWT